VAKKVVGQIKLQIPAGAANPAMFCKAFNAQTQNMAGFTVPVVVTVFSDRSFTFVTKSPPASNLLLKAAGVEKGSPMPNKNKVGKATKAQIEEIAKTKVKDLTAANIEAAMKTVSGTARSMGIDIVE